MKSSRFDQVMAYIEVNIREDIETIKNGIYKEIGFNSNTFNNCFKVLTNTTLFHYISQRKLYYAAWSLQNEADRSIADIAFECGYSDQTALTRAFRQYFDTTPNDIRKGKIHLADNRYRLADICKNSNQQDTRIQSILLDLENTGDLSMANWSYLMKLEQVNQEFGFDTDTLYKIAELAEALEIPVDMFIEECYNLQIDVHSDPNYLFPDEEFAINLGIHSDEELKAICEYYHCKYYDLDSNMVERFQKHHQSHD